MESSDDSEIMEDADCHINSSNSVISPIIDVFERLSFKRRHDIHDCISSLINYFSSVDIDLEMLDILVDCIRISFVNPQLHKKTRIIDFLANFTHIAYINMNVNKNLAMVFETLFDLYCQVIYL